MGRHRMKRQRNDGAVSAALRRLRVAVTAAPQRTTAEQLSLLDTDGVLTGPPAAPAPPWRRAPQGPPQPPPPATGDRPSSRADLRVVRDRRPSPPPISTNPDIVPVPSVDDVKIRYPDGRVVPIGWHAEQPTTARHRRYVADVPDAATLSTGMVIQAGPVVMPVRLVHDSDVPPAWIGPGYDDWHHGGGDRP